MAVSTSELAREFGERIAALNRRLRRVEPGREMIVTREAPSLRAEAAHRLVRAKGSAPQRTDDRA